MTRARTACNGAAPPRRILILSRNLPPMVGGMERLNWHMAAELSFASAVRVVGPSMAASMVPQGVAFTAVPLQPLAAFIAVSLLQAIRLARQFRPEVVLAGSGLSAPAAWCAAKVGGARSVVYLHGLDVAVDHAGYQRLWLPFIRRMDRVIANSSVTRRLAIERGVRTERIDIVPPGVQEPGERDYAAEAEFLRVHDLEGCRILLSLGRLTARKGVREFVEDVLPRIVRRHPEAMLVVIGSAPAQALGAEVQSIESIRAAASRAQMEHHVRFLGEISEYSRLSVAYRVADVNIFPVRDLPKDPEGFGMVAVEAAIHGLPTVAYASGGVVDAVAHDRSGLLVPPGDAIAFAAAVNRLLDRRLPADAVRAHGERYTWSHFGKALQAALTDSPLDRAGSR